MNAAVENLFSVSFSAVAFFLIALVMVRILKRTHKAPEFRLVKRKPLLIPAIIFLLILPFTPRQHIGPPPGMESNAILNQLGGRLEVSFEVYEWAPYLPRIRIDYSYPLEREEIIECTVLVCKNEALIQNSTAEIHYSGASYRLSTALSTFDLAPGNYSLIFTQRVLRADGTPTLYIRNVLLSFSQLQDYAWIEISLQWEQILLVLYIAGVGLLLLGIYYTDHRFDTPDEYERYQRRKNGERNYPYDRGYRRNMKRKR